jgi:multiple sugar transport system permease protein
VAAVLYITWPLLCLTMVVVLFSVIQTFSDFQIVYVMTGGGLTNATHLFATYAYQLGVGTVCSVKGAAVSLAMFPLLFGIVIFQLMYIPGWRHGDEQLLQLRCV